ncbi:MAG TPA: hypothetical protein VMA53_04205 [Stellaceae bacterium]|nr:hypothetical protein [Stellaceae bacterium]
MRLSRALLDAVAAALPLPGEAGLATQAVHDRVGGWNRTTVRHALRQLIREGRAGFSGCDRHRRYRRAGGPGFKAPPPPPPIAPLPAEEPAPSWREYGLRGDGSVHLPDERAIAAAMRRHAIRYRDVGAAELLAEERIVGWSWRKRSNAELTRAVFGDPAPGRRLPARSRSGFASAQAGLPPQNIRGPYERKAP